MIRRRRCLAELLVLAGCLFAAAAAEKEVNGDEPTQEKSPQVAKKLADGVYAVLRDSDKAKEVLPLKVGESLVVHRHRYLKKGDNEPPRFLVVRSAPSVTLDLAEVPKTAKEGEGSSRTQVSRTSLKNAAPTLPLASVGTPLRMRIRNT
jgi:hypothetical protein